MLRDDRAVCEPVREISPARKGSLIRLKGAAFEYFMA